LEKSWLCTANCCSVWVHRTIRCARLGSGELATLENSSAAYDYNSPDCPVCTGQCSVSQRSAGLTVGCAIHARHVAEPTVGRGHRTVRCANGSKAANGRLRQIRKEIRTGLSGAPGDRRQELPSQIALNGS